MKHPIGRSFPNTCEAVAFYDPATFNIVLNNITEKEFTSLLGTELSFSNIDKFKTFYHELRHFCDHFSSLWGQRWLLSYIKAISAKVNNQVQNLRDIVIYKNKENQNFFLQYYTEEYSRVPVNNPLSRWKSSISSGLRFNHLGEIDQNRPIPFIKFNSHNDEPLIRVPLSVASLLETNAKYEEIRLHLALIAALPKEQAHNRMKEFSNELFQNLIYNQDLVVYNAAVHVAANLLGISDFAVAYQISSYVATLTLNLPSSLLSSLIYNKANFEAWGQRAELMIRNHEYGFIYYILLENYSSSYKADGKFSVDALLNCSGLPEYKVLEEMISEESLSIIKTLGSMNIFLPDLLNRCTQGLRLTKQCGILLENEPFFKVMSEIGFSTGIYCSDTDYVINKFSVKEVMQMKPLKVNNEADWLGIIECLDQALTEFYEVRGV